MRIKSRNLVFLSFKTPLFIFLVVLIISLFLNPEKAYANVASMYLSPSSHIVAQGDLFDVEIGLDNPSASAFDTLSVWLIFDPFYLEVQDTDAGNWITTGLNVLDGPYHSTYAFNFHLANNADNTAGEIVYTESILASSLASSGTFARITFRALNVTPSTPLDFDFNWGFPKDTAVMLGGEDVLGSSSNHTDGAMGADVTVVPEPVTFLLLGTGAIPILYLFRKKK